MKKNQFKLLLLLLGIISVLYLTAYGFELRIQTTLWILLIKFILILFTLILFLFFRMKWIYKLIGIGALVFFYIYVIPASGLWKFSLNRYVRINGDEYENCVQGIQEIDTSGISYFSCSEQNEMDFSWTDDSLKLAKKISYSKACSILNSLESNEVFINSKNHLYLFALSRFIDNGYGILFSSDGLSEKSIIENRIAGLDITSCSLPQIRTVLNSTKLDKSPQKKYQILI